MIYEVLQTEKAYRTQEGNTYAVVFRNNEQPTKVQVKQMLKQGGFTPLKVTKVVPPTKTKSRNGRRSTIRVKRPVKYYITLKEGETLIQDTNQEVTN